MRCCVAFCKNTADHVSTSDGKSLSNDKGISFHGFPRDVHLHAAWLRALGRQDAPLPDTAVVCSQHFLLDDFHEEGSGLRQLRASAVPSTVQVCTTCLVTDTKMFLISKYKLNEVYEKLTGYPLYTQGNLKQTVCALCAQNLINFHRFRNKSLRALSLMIDIVRKHEISTMFGPQHCDLHILYDDRRTEGTKDTVYRVEKSVTVENKRSDGLELIDPEEIVKDHCYARKVCEKNSISDESIMLASKLVDDELCKVLQRTKVASSSAVKEQASRIKDSIKVCMTCLVNDTNMFSMSKHKLNEVYEKLTGYPHLKQENLKQTICIQCTQRLIKFNRFRDKCLRARSLMMDLVDKHEIITIRHIKMINRTKHQLKDNFVKTTFKPDHCDLHILYDDTQTEALKDTAQSVDETVIVKNESSDHPNSMNNEKIVIDDHTSNVSAENSMSNESIMLALKIVDAELCKALQTPQAASSSVVTKRVPRKQDLSKIKDTSSIECVLCFEEFTSESEHLKHITQHLQNMDSDGERDTSQVCEPSTSASSSKGSWTFCPSEIHNTIARTSLNKPFSCHLCDFRYRYFYKFVDHMRTHTGEKPFACTLCEYKCAVKSTLVVHMKTHSNERPFSCQLCDYTCKLNGHLVSHMRIHSGEKPFSCEICGRRFAQSNQLHLHLRSHTGIRPFACQLCDFKFARKCHLKRHMSTHTGEKPFPCRICNLKFSRKCHARRHMATHTGEKPFSCDMCNRKFAQKKTLVSHIKTHSDKKPFSCDICNRKFAQKIYIVSHMKTHTGEKPFSCALCDRKFAHSSTLSGHIKSKSCTKHFSCDLCNRKFARKKDIVIHMKTHTDKKPFSRELRHRKFARRNTLVGNVKTKSCKKLFACDFCDRKFVRKGTLVTHIETHKPRFSCDLCNRNFVKKSSIALHMKTHSKSAI